MHEGSYSETIVKFSFSSSKENGVFLSCRRTAILCEMLRILLALLSIVIISLLVGKVTPSNAQEAGTLSVTTAPVGGAIYVDYLLMGTRFWSGNLIAGSHLVSFGDVDGYIAPSPQTVTVVADQTFYIVGVYRKLLSLQR